MKAFFRIFEPFHPFNRGRFLPARLHQIILDNPGARRYQRTGNAAVRHQARIQFDLAPRRYHEIRQGSEKVPVEFQGGREDSRYNGCKFEPIRIAQFVLQALEQRAIYHFGNVGVNLRIKTGLNLHIDFYEPQDVDTINGLI